MPGKKYVFISYSSKDLAVVNVVLGVLRDMNIAYWKAPENIPAGSSYAQEIVSALSNCSLVLVFLSANSQSSQWVEKEIDSAVNYNKKIIPLMIDDKPMNGVFRFYLNNVQMIFYKQDPKAAIEDLKPHLEALGLHTPNKKAMFLRKTGTPAAKTETPKPAAKKAPAPKTAAAPRGTASFGKVAFKPGNTGTAKPSSVGMASQGAKPPAQKGKRRMKPVDFASKNRRPIDCQYCGGALTNAGNGIYVCASCGLDNYDDFTEIRRYITQFGPAPVSELSRELQIPRDIINDFRNRNSM